MKTMILKNMMKLTMAALRQVLAMALGGDTSELLLASSPSGRIVLHVLCARRDRHFSWHWRGILREFAMARASV